MRIQHLATLAAIVLLATMAPHGAQAQANSSKCTNRLLSGIYGFTLTGTKLGGAPGTPVGPQVGVAMTTFDGAGNLSQIDSVTVGGNVVSDFTHPRATGTYSVNPDCTGTYVIDFADGRPPVTVNFVISMNGTEIDGVVVAPGGGILSIGATGKKRFFASAILR